GAQHRFHFHQPGPAMAADRKTGAHSRLLLPASHLINPNAAHLEAPRNLRRTIPAIQGSQHALPQILRIGLHLRLPSTSRKYYRMKCIYLNRKRFRRRQPEMPHGLGLSRQDVGQRPLDAIHFFTNDPDCLLMAGIRHRGNGRYCVTNLVVPIPDQVDPRRGLHPVLVNPSSQLRGHPSERQPEQHLDWKAVGCSIEIEEREPIDGFAKTKGSEYHSQPNQSKRQAVKGSKLQRRLVIPTVLRDCHLPPKGYVTVRKLYCATTVGICGQHIRLAWIFFLQSTLYPRSTDVSKSCSSPHTGCGP